MPDNDHPARMLVVPRPAVGLCADRLQVGQELGCVLRANPMGGRLAAEEAGPVIERRREVASLLEGLTAPAQINTHDSARVQASDVCRLVFQKSKSFQDPLEIQDIAVRCARIVVPPVGKYHDDYILVLGDFTDFIDDGLLLLSIPKPAEVVELNKAQKVVGGFDQGCRSAALLGTLVANRVWSLCRKRTKALEVSTALRNAEDEQHGERQQSLRHLSLLATPRLGHWRRRRTG
jgi:hypothetical protein